MELRKPFVKFAAEKSGAVIVELVVGLGFIMLVCLGFAQLFIDLNTKIKMEGLRSQLQLGPIDRPLGFSTNSNSPSFTLLSGSTLNSFFQNLQNHGLSIDPKVNLLINLSYIVVNSTTGLPLRVTNLSTWNKTINKSSWCAKNSSTLGSELSAFAQEQLNKMISSSTTTPSTSLGTSPIGIKLFDVNVGTANYKSYLNYVPVISLLMCSDPNPPLYTKAFTYKTIIIPRTNIN